MALNKPVLDRQMVIGDVAKAARSLLRRSLWPTAAVLLAECGILFFESNPGVEAFALIGVGCVALLSVWCRDGVGLPLIPLIAIQNLIAYGLPIATHNETILPYSESEVTAAGWEILTFSLTLIAGWWVGMQIFPRSQSSCYALQGLNDNSPKLIRIGMGMSVASSVYLLLKSFGMLTVFTNMLPTGSDSILNVVVAAVSACGFFLAALMIGRNALNSIARGLFWALLIFQCYVQASAFLLSGTITVLFSVLIGLFWGGGRVPWRFLAITLLVLSYMNVGKFTMRERYWLKDEGNPIPEIALTATPHYYTEWIQASWAMLAGSESDQENKEAFNAIGASTDHKEESGQSLLQRINNLQNLLYVIDAMRRSHIEPLHGATYSLIPPLLIPRIIYGPDKPRSHEGQVLLNVYFRRQQLESTYETYVAWGLIAEAYGNFGPYAGSIVLGIVLGALFAWVEKFVARKLVLSTEGFVSFTLVLGLANSFEMVASVLVTSLFQACLPIILASAPFVHRVSGKAQIRPVGDVATPPPSDA